MFFEVLETILSFLKIEINVYGFTVSFWHVFIYVPIAYLILSFIRSLLDEI